MNLELAISYIHQRLLHELSADLFYHGPHHTLDVVIAVRQLAAVEHIQGDDLILLETAAWFHDSGFLNTYANHEEAGVAIARKMLPQFGYNEQHLTKIEGMIMATKIPQSPKNQLEEIICDADLEYLGGGSYYAVSENLRKELSMRGILATPKQWLEMQVKFLDAHQYFTFAAKARGELKKRQRLKELEKQLQALAKSM